jgi:hypothetical protein
MGLTLTESDIHAIEAIASSPSVLGMAEAILSSLDRRLLAELLSASLYLKSEGRDSREIALFLLTREKELSLRLGLRLGSSVVAGVLLEPEFRGVVTSLMARTIRGKAGRQ